MRLSIGTFILVAAAVAIGALAGVGSSGSAISHATSATHGAAGANEARTSFVSNNSSASGSSAGATAGAGSALEAQPQQAAHVQRINLEIRTTEKVGGEEQPRYVPAGATAASLKSWTGNLTVKKGEPVVITIVNSDDGSAPLAAGFSQFDNVQGGTETVEGVPVRSVPNEDVAHTFTVLGMNVNAAIPAAPEGRTDTVVLKFTPTTTGTFPWQCFAPCGTWSNGFGGAMDMRGWMKGSITVVS